MAGTDNLKVPTSEEAREFGRRGGIASAKKRRERKAMKETLEELLSMPLKKGASADISKVRNIAAMKGKNITMQEAIMLSMLQKAAKGDVRAAEFVRDTAGQRPTDKMDMSVELPVFFAGEDELE